MRSNGENAPSALAGVPTPWLSSQCYLQLKPRENRCPVLSPWSAIPPAPAGNALCHPGAQALKRGSCQSIRVQKFC